MSTRINVQFKVVEGIQGLKEDHTFVALDEGYRDKIYIAVVSILTATLVAALVASVLQHRSGERQNKMTPEVFDDPNSDKEHIFDDDAVYRTRRYEDIPLDKVAIETGLLNMNRAFKKDKSKETTPDSNG